MKFSRKVVILISILVIGSNFQSHALCKGFTDEPIKILFIGNSNSNSFNMPALFGYLAISAGKEVYIGRHIINGTSLSQHANSVTAEAKIYEEDWDYVYLQGSGPAIAYPDEFTNQPVFPALEVLRAKISANCITTNILLCLTPAYEDGMTWYGWSETYPEFQIKIYEQTLLYADSLGFTIAPVGWAWKTVLEEKDYPLHYLHMDDWSHPSLRGSYITACVIYSTIFKESSVDINYFGDLQDEEEANYFQVVASNTVLDSLELWNISKESNGIPSIPVPDHFYLYQNYPNPFETSTQIKYEISKNSLVQISVHDILGKTMKILVNEHINPGNYSVWFDGSDLDNGVYLYKIKSGSQNQIRKMLLIK